MTAAEYRDAEDRYQRALIELREARNALAEAEREVRADVRDLDALDRRMAGAR